MINNLSTYQGLQTQSEEVAQIEKFNNQYIIYNRDDVRGSDLYSLMNKVIDYNIRQSTEGKELGQNGQYVGYRPMSISIDLKSYQSNLAYLDGKIDYLQAQDMQLLVPTMELKELKKKLLI